jgi:Cd2+/Zn2+-exporting ATPase
MSVQSGESASEESRTELRAPSMDCPSCASTVSGALEALPGVIEYDLSPATGRVRVVHDGSLERERIVAAVEGAGYDVVEEERARSVEALVGEPVWRSRRAVVTAASGVLLAAALLAGLLAPGTVGGVAVTDLLLSGAIVLGGAVILREGVGSARRLSLDMDFLMSAAVVGAVTVTLVTGESLLVEAASLAVLFNLAEVLEDYSVQRARGSLAELVSLAPETAVVRGPDGEAEVPVEAVDVGDVVLVEPGEKVPVDGEVVEGESAVDEAPVTGESVPVDKTVGDEVYAGTVNEHGYLEVRATATADDSTLSRVVDLVEGAQEQKTEREQFVERFAEYYTPIVVAAAVLTAVGGSLLFGDPVEWVVRGIALLVVACPCAFVISTPVTVVSGVTSAARNGVLVKGGDHLEAMGDVDVVAFDKTGTLTTGDLEVTDVVPLNGNSEADVLACARGLESRSEHPIATAIVGETGERGETAASEAGHAGDVEGFESLTGRGVRAEIGGRTHYAGKPGLFAELGFDLDHVHFTTGGGDLPAETRQRCEREGCLDLVADTIPRLQAEGKTVVLVGTEDELEGVVAVADSVRPEARRAVERLREQGVHTVMLTGDNEGTARAVAEQIGVDEFRAELLPEEKVDAVEELLADHGGVAMVGDGINDAPALATATVGIAMGAAGSDTAIETADVALLGDDLSKLPYLYELSRTSGRVVRQNVYGSLAVKALLAVGIPLGYVSMVVAVLAGDVGMTTVVTGNAMRLAGIEPDSSE